MKKKFISFLLVGIVAIMMLPTMPLESYAANTTLEALQQKFPCGKYWNSGNPDTYTSVACKHHNPNASKACCSHTGCNAKDTNGHCGYCCVYGDCGCTSFGNAIQCCGFAKKLAYDYYGSYFTNWSTTSISNVKPGDVIYYNKYHYVWVTARNGNILTIGECNYSGPCQITWGRSLNITKISPTTVYSAPYALNNVIPNPSKPTISNVSVNGTSVTVSWTTVSSASKYTVDFCKVNDSTYTHDYYDTTSTSMTKVLSYGQYAIRVCASNSAGESGYTSFWYIDVYSPIPISFDANGGELERTKARINYDSINGGRGENQLVIYTNGGSGTGTNQYGTEVVVSPTQEVTNIIDHVGNAKVPYDGFILSGHGEKGYWLINNVEIGDYANYHPNTQEAWIWTENGWLTWTKKVKNGGNYGDLPVPLARDGYDFIGWFTSAEGGTQIASDTTVTTSSAQTLYAHWESTYSDTDMPLNTSMGVSKLSEGQYKVDCTAENISPNDVSGILYFAVYSDSKLKSIFSEPLTVAKKSSENYSKTITADRADIIKVFAWKNSLSPLSNAKSEHAEKEVSDWVLKSEMPSGANIVETKYTYTQTSYKESQSVVIDGWENYDSYWKQTGSASFNYADFPSGFNTNHQYYKNWQKSACTAYENDTAKRTVSNTQQGYVYWHWCRGDDSLNLGYSRAVWDYHKSGFDDFEAFTSTENKTEYADGCYKFANASVCKDSYWWYKLPYYQCSYVDYSKMYKFRKIENLESEFSPSGDNVSNIQEWVKYRV